MSLAGSSGSSLCCPHSPEGTDGKRSTEVKAGVGPEQWLAIASTVGGTSALSLASSRAFL